MRGDMRMRRKAPSCGRRKASTCNGSTVHRARSTFHAHQLPVFPSNPLIHSNRNIEPTVRSELQ
jgi:hypothetical protein